MKKTGSEKFKNVFRPNWVSYPEWLNKDIDRIKATDEILTGNTSGDNYVRRIPNVADVVTDNQYLSSVFENPQDGLKDVIKPGGKSAVAKEMASQYALEVWRDKVLEGIESYHDVIDIQDKIVSLESNVEAEQYKIDKATGTFKDATVKRGVAAIKEIQSKIDDSNKEIDKINKYISDTNPVFDYFRKNQELQGAVIAEVKQGEIIKQFQQGNKKEAKTVEEKKKEIDKAVDIAGEVLTHMLKGAKTDKEAIEIIGIFKANVGKSFATSVAINLRDTDYKKLKKNEGILNLIITPAYEKWATANKIKYNGFVLKGRSIMDNDGKPLTGAIWIKTRKNNFEVGKSDSNAHRKKSNEMFFELIEYITNEKKYSLEDKLAFVEIMAKDQAGLIRQVYQEGSGVVGLSKKEMGDFIAEHNPPIEVFKNEINNYLKDPSLEKLEVLKSMASEGRVNFIPKEVSDKLPVRDTKDFLRYKDPYFLSAFHKWLTEKEALFTKRGELAPELVMDAREMGFNDYADLRAQAEAASRVEGIKRESKTNEINSKAIEKSLTNEYTNDVKKIRVFDFDKTLAETNNKVNYFLPDGTKGELDALEFAEKSILLENDGAIFDFSDFLNVTEGSPGPLLDVAKVISAKRGAKDVFVLTARPGAAAGPIQEFLKAMGLDLPIENISGLGDGSPKAKADWIAKKALEGYNDFYFADDHLPNVKAVKDVLSVLDVKSKVQQAKKRFSKTLSPEFNKIIQDVKGVEDYKKFSEIVGKRRGAKKNKFDFYVPPSAADFELLLYNFMGKGKEGDAHKEFFNNALLKPYANGVALMDAARQSIKREYKSLLKAFPEISSKLEKLTPDKDFTIDQALRVSIWNGAGVEIPGLSERDTKKLTELVDNDPELSAFKQGLMATSRQENGWTNPSSHWDADTIISDLYNITEGEGRKQFLGEFIDNASEVFGTWEGGKLVGPNMNKIEAVYGTSVRESLEDSLYRMTNGKNKSFGADSETNRWNSWVNGSVGTIMFLNTRSAALQLTSAVNFLNFRDNNPFAAASAFANQKQYWSDFAHIFNSDKLKERRGGLKDDIQAAEIANAARGSQNKAKSSGGLHV
jgi:hypothetical protein